MSNEQKLREALQQALTALENVITQVKYDEECAAAIIAARQTLATTEPEPTGMPEFPPLPRCMYQNMQHQRMYIGNVYTADQVKAYGEQCWKAGYKHGAWGTDTKDAERYRWLRDDTDSDWVICEWSHAPGDEGYYRDARAPHIVDAAIDAAMAQGVRG